MLGYIQDNGPFERGWLLSFGTDGKLGGTVATVDQLRLSYDYTFPTKLGKLHHQVLTYDPDGVDKVVLYCDGDPVQFQTRTGDIAYADAQLVLGAYLDDNELYPLDGVIGGGFIYNRALGADEVEGRFARGIGAAGTFCPVETTTATTTAPSTTQDARIADLEKALDAANEKHASTSEAVGNLTTAIVDLAAKVNSLEADLRTVQLRTTRNAQQLAPMGSVLSGLAQLRQTVETLTLGLDGVERELEAFSAPIEPTAPTATPSEPLLEAGADGSMAISGDSVLVTSSECPAFDLCTLQRTVGAMVDRFGAPQGPD